MRRLWWLLPVLAGGVLRFRGIAFGWPILSNLYVRPDESLVVVSGVEFFKNAGAPGTYAYPALFLEMAAAVYRLMGADSPFQFGLDPSPYFLVVRCLAALFGTATVLMVYAVARLVLDRPWASLAALAYAVSPLAVRDAHFGVTDVPSVFFQTAVVWFALRYLDCDQRTSRREFWVAAAALALSMTTKYAGLLLASVPASAVVLRAARTGEPIPWRRLAGAALAIAIFFVAVNPYLFLDFGKASREIWSILVVLYLWQPGDPAWTLPAAVGQIVVPHRNGCGGWPGLSLALLGIGYALWKRDWRLSLIAQPVLSTFLVLLPFQHSVPHRYLLPALPGIAVLSVALLAWVARRYRAVALSVGVLLLVAPEAWTATRFVRLLAMEDTRTLAGRWIQALVPRQTPIVWLGGPECEPQFVESPASIGRRIQFAYRRYGPVSGAIVSAPYRLMKQAIERRGLSGWEVFRNPPGAEMPSSEFVLVTPEYPLRMARYTLPVPSESLEPLGTPVVFPSLAEGVQGGLELDQIDAWFLPFRPLDRVLRPGPGLRIQRMRVR